MFNSENNVKPLLVKRKRKDVTWVALWSKPLSNTNVFPQELLACKMPPGSSLGSIRTTLCYKIKSGKEPLRLGLVNPGISYSTATIASPPKGHCTTALRGKHGDGHNVEASKICFVTYVTTSVIWRTESCCKMLWGSVVLWNRCWHWEIGVATGTVHPTPPWKQEGHRTSNLSFQPRKKIVYWEQKCPKSSSKASPAKGLIKIPALRKDKTFHPISGFY